MDIDLDESHARLIVDGAFTTDTTRHYVKLSKTMDYFANKETEPISNASVMINDFLLTENDSIPGLYQTEPTVYGEIGKEYTLTIENVDIDNDGNSELYEATSKIHSIAQPDSIDVVYQKYYDQRWWDIQLFAQDPPEENFYLFKIYKNGKLLSDTADEYGFQDDLFFNGNYVNGVPVQMLDENIKEQRLEKGDIITLEINAITNGYYVYLIELTNEASGSNPLFSGPPANLSTNVSGGNGAVGYFKTYSIARMSKNIHDPYEKVKEWP
jgi:hypothetical protein